MTHTYTLICPRYHGQTWMVWVRRWRLLAAAGGADHVPALGARRIAVN